MIVGVPREVKDSEARVAMTPEGVRELVAEGHLVLVQEGAGEGSSITNADYRAAGAKVVGSAGEVFSEAEMVVKVKEPQLEEYEHLREGQLLFTYLHLAAEEKLARFLVERRVTAIAYETVQTADGRLPLLAPMSAIAGRIAPHVAATYLEHPRGGRGVLMGGVVGVAPARVLVLGAGTAGMNAATIAVGMQADVCVLDRNVDRLEEITRAFGGRITTGVSSSIAIERLVHEADVVIGAVLVPGSRAPKLVTEDMVRDMQPGAVLVDVSIDQGGCFATSRVTSHSDPVYMLHDVVHYCVGNMPGAVPRTATYALTNATLGYVIALARNGLHEAMRSHPSLAPGLNVHDGGVVNSAVAEATGLPVASPAMVSA